MATNLPSCFFNSIFRATPEVSGKLYFVEISLSLREVMVF